MAATTIPSIFRSRLAFALEAERQPQATTRELAEMADIAQRFMGQYRIPGLSVAIARHGQFVYSRGFGYADTAKREPVAPSHLFRIASVTKPITSAAVFSLIEQGKLRLNDPIFGKHGVLQFDYGRIDSGHLRDIAVYHLLTHTCGGWGNQVDDPMFANPTMDQKQLIEATLRDRPLKYAPGKHYSYSNFGYCLLGRVIEKVSGQSYTEFVQRNILELCGITDMQLSGNTLAERVHGEVTYYEQRGGDPYGMNLQRMDSHGGWVGTPSDLVKFAMHVDGFNTTSNILKPETIKSMTKPSTACANYACGWEVNTLPNWWHTGKLPGTFAILVRTSSGLCWSALMNTCVNDFDLAVDRFMWKMVRAVPAWQA